MLQFCGWAALFQNMIDVNVRYELACKIYFEFLHGDDRSDAIGLSRRVYDSLVSVLDPLMDADDFASICDLPLSFFQEAVENLHQVVRERMYLPCLKELRERVKTLEEQAACNDASSDVSKELATVTSCTRLTFEEFLAVVVKYRESAIRRSPPTSSLPPTPAASNSSSPAISRVPSGTGLAKAASMLRLSPRTSGVRHGSVGSEDEGQAPAALSSVSAIPVRLGENPHLRGTGQRHQSMRQTITKRGADPPQRHGSVGSESDAPTPPPKVRTGAVTPDSRTSAEYVIPVRSASSSGVVRESERDEYIIGSGSSRPQSPRGQVPSSPRKQLPSIATLSPPSRPSPSSRVSQASPRSNDGFEDL